MPLQKILLYFLALSVYACQAPESLSPDLPTIKLESLSENPNAQHGSTMQDSLSAPSDPSSQRKKPRPKGKEAYLVLDSSQINLAKLKNDSLYTFDLGFENHGQAPLQILKIEQKPTQNALRIRYEDVLWAFAERDSLHFSLQTPRKIGPWQTELILHTNAKNTPTRLLIKAQIQAK